MLKKLLISLMILCGFAANAYAAKPAEIEVSIEDSTFTITGEVNASARVKDVSVTILYPEKELSDVFEGDPMDSVAFAGQFHVNLDNSFEIVASINGETGYYNVYVDYAGNTKEWVDDGDEENGREGVLFVKKSDNDAAIASLLGASDAGTIARYLKDSDAETPLLTDDGVWQNLYLKNSLFKELDTTQFSKKYLALKQEENINAGSRELAQKLFDQAVVLQAVSEGKIAKIYDSLETMEIDKTKTIAKSNKNASAAFTQKVNEILKAKKADNLEKFESALEEATVLATVKTCENGPIKDIILEFASKIGISNPSTSSAVYANLKGTNASDYSTLKIAYQKALSGVQDGNKEDNYKDKDKDSVIGIPLPDDKSNPIEIVEPKETFTDLGNVAWAKDAIMNLYTKGIIAGKGDNKFAPNDPLTREQFVLMVTKAFNLQQGNAVSFNDVKSTDWFYNAVNAAYNNGVTKGMGNNFGVGMNITREDMAVMVYNAVRSSGMELSQTEIDEEFTDADKISAYAKNAVEYLRSAKVINGMGDGTFNPKGANTRAQAAVVINAVLNAVKGA